MKTAKKKDQAAPGKTFQIGGTIKLAGPGFRGTSEQRMEEESVELNITTEQAKEGKIMELEPWIRMQEADIKISARDTKDFGPDEDLLDIFFEGAAGRSLGIVINSGQAKALNEILSNFIRAYDSWAAFDKVYPVSAAA